MTEQILSLGKPLGKEEQITINGGRASEARCNRMIERHIRRGGGNTRLWRRILKNQCFG